MKKTLLLIAIVFFLGSIASAQFSFYLIDNFEGGDLSDGPKWWSFGTLKTEMFKNEFLKKPDLIADSCGLNSLRLSGSSANYYVGGMGTDLSVDAENFSRFQIDVFNNGAQPAKLIVEFFDDDNNNYSIEQDPQQNYAPVYDDKFVAEILVQGKGFTRVSIPFIAFHDANPGVGDDIWNPSQTNDSGGLLKMQLVVISDKQQGDADIRIDNLLLTY